MGGLRERGGANVTFCRAWDRRDVSTGTSTIIRMGECVGGAIFPNIDRDVKI